MDLRPAFRSQYSSDANLMEPEIAEWAYDLALRDADSLISAPFHVPKDLRETVNFWLHIYTQFTTQHVVIFDSKHPELVYEVLDFRPLSKTARGPIAYEITRTNRVKKAMAKYRVALARLAGHPKAAPSTPEEKNIVAALKKARHKHKLSDLAQNVRSQTGQRDNIVKGLLAAEAFFPKMEDLFRRVGTPIELTRLSLVESSFDLRAESRVGAAGIWQFMRNPGREFLLIDPNAKVDERLSPLKSTVAAGRLLNENYRRFKSWPLAVTSYNHGLKGLMKLKQKSEDFNPIAHLFEGCSKTSPLGWAARNYYAEFLAVLHAEHYRKVFYGEPPITQLRPVAFQIAPTGKSALRVAMDRGIPLQEFKLLNPDIQDLRRPLPIGFYIAVPGTSDDLAGLIPRHPNQHRQARLNRSSRRA